MFVSQVVFEGVPSYPTAGRLWDIVDKFGVTHLYTAPTLIRALMGAGDELVEVSDVCRIAFSLFYFPQRKPARNCRANPSRRSHTHDNPPGQTL
jgi:hypothetical protein